MNRHLRLKLLVSFIVCFWPPCCAKRGMVMACNDYYLKEAVVNLTILRDYFQTQMPVEIWYSGDELCDYAKLVLRRFAPIEFKDVVEIEGGNASEYQGYQIKGYAVAHTLFDEVLLIDADLCFFQNPEVLFEEASYKETGTYLFRDQEWGTQGGVYTGRKARYKAAPKRSYKNPYYFSRKKFLSRVIDSPSSYCPLEWRHYWDPSVNPTQSVMISIEHGESGCLLIDKRRHKKGVSNILALNRDHKNMYKIFHGDKETFWVSFEMAKEPYYVNAECPKIYVPRLSQLLPRNEIVQFLHGKLFYQQKSLLKPTYSAYFYDTNHQEYIEDVNNLTKWSRKLSTEERDLYNELYLLSHSINMRNFKGVDKR